MPALKIYACGIDAYTHQPNLRFCSFDARLFATTMERFSEASIEEVLLAPADRSASVVSHEVHQLLDGIRRLSAGPGDAVVFYFAGHGIERNGSDYLLASDSDVRPNAPTPNFIQTNEVISALRASGAQSAILVVDACRSIGARDAAPFFGESTRAVAKQQGIVSIYGCAPGEVSFEAAELGERGHGVFTYVLSELIRERQQLVPVFANGELIDRVDATCRAHGLGQQTPEIALTSLALANVDLLTGKQVKLSERTPRMILLAGPPHTGKSTIGTRLAQKLGFTQLEMSTYAHARYQAAREQGEFTGLIQEYMDDVVWSNGEYDVIATDLLSSNNGVNELVVCGPRRAEEVESFRAAGYEVEPLYLYSDSRTRYERYLRASESTGTPEYSVALEWFVRRDLTEHSWGLPKIGLMNDCHIVENTIVDTTVELILSTCVPRHWHATG